MNRAEARAKARALAQESERLRRVADALYSLDPQDPLQPAHLELYAQADELDQEVDAWCSIAANRRKE